MKLPWMVGSDAQETKQVGPLRVFVVDGNCDVCRGIEEALSRDPRISWVISATEWQLALKEIPLRGPDIILLDQHINGLNALDLIKPLFNACPGARVIILCGAMTVEGVETALDDGAWGFICKSEDIETMIRRMQDVAGGAIGLCPAARRLLGSH